MICLDKTSFWQNIFPPNTHRNHHEGEGNVFWKGVASTIRSEWMVKMALQGFGWQMKILWMSLTMHPHFLDENCWICCSVFQTTPHIWFNGACNLHGIFRLNFLEIELNQLGHCHQCFNNLHDANFLEKFFNKITHSFERHLKNVISCPNKFLISCVIFWYFNMQLCFIHHGHWPHLHVTKDFWNSNRLWVFKKSIYVF